MDSFFPFEQQTPINPADHIVEFEGSASDESIDLDVLFVGAGPASLSSAIKLADLAREQSKELQIGIIEKADQLGGHTLSGAIVNPMIFEWLFPDKKPEELPFKKKITKESFRILTKNNSLYFPVPPGMKAKNCYSASLCEIVRWLGAEAEKRSVHIFTSYPGDKLLTKNNKVIGVRSKAFGLNKDGSHQSSYDAATDIFAKVVVLSEGTRGHLTSSYLSQKNIKSKYPQTYALGVKEVWEVKKEPRSILHTMGWPLKSHTFGGAWLYPLGNNMISLGLVVGLDSVSANLSVHDKLQVLKEHKLFAKLLEGGKCIEWGAKTIPEGGYHSWPEQLHGNGILIVGDSAGFVNMASLKGVHYAMASGYFAATSLMEAFIKNDFSEKTLKTYDQKIKNSFIAKDLYKSRNLRQSFHKGLFSGLIKAGLITLTNGKWPTDFKPTKLLPDSQIQKIFKDEKEKHQGHKKVDAVYLSGNKTRDKIPSHLITKKNLSKNIGRFYEKMCPAGVYEQKENELIVNAPNCIDCKATDILGPRWTPRERGSGPNYKQM